MVSTVASAGTKAPSATVGVRLALLTIVVFFGSSLPAYKIATRSFGPATSNLIRFVLAAMMLVVVARNRLHTAAEHRTRLIIIGVFGLGLMAVFMGVGVDRGTATVGSVIVGLEPIGVALAGVMFVGDRPNRRIIVALALGSAGAFVASGVFTEPRASAPLLPVVLLLGTVVTFSIYTALVRRTPASVDRLAVAAYTQVGALAFVIPACLFDIADGGMVRGDIRLDAVIATIVLGVGSAVAYLLLCVVLANQPSSRVAVSMYLTPMFGVLFSWWIVGEKLHTRTAVGAALVLAAVAISEWNPGRAAT